VPERPSRNSLSATPRPNFPPAGPSAKIKSRAGGGRGLPVRGAERVLISLQRLACRPGLGGGTIEWNWSNVEESTCDWPRPLGLSSVRTGSAHSAETWVCAAHCPWPTHNHDLQACGRPSTAGPRRSLWKRTQWQREAAEPRNRPWPGALCGQEPTLCGDSAAGLVIFERRTSRWWQF